MGVFLSVIVPVHNTGKYLLPCLDSLAAQTFHDMEIILVDDGSTDGSGKVCDDYAAKNPRFRVLHKKNGGPGSAKREGLKAAQGAYIGLTDSDDRVEPDYYEKLVRQAKEHGADIVTCGRCIDGTDKTKTDLLPAGVYRGGRLLALQKNTVYGVKYETDGISPSACTKIYRKEVIEPFLSAVPDGLFAWEDLCYTYPPFFLATCVVVTHETGYLYRVNTDSVSHRADDGKWEQILRTTEAARPAYERFSPEILLSFDTRCTYIFCTCLWTMCIREREAGKSVKETAARLKRETEQKLFREIAGTVFNEGTLVNKINRRFLTEIMHRRYMRAVRYCRLRTGIPQFVRKCFSVWKNRIFLCRGRGNAEGQ